MYNFDEIIDRRKRNSLKWDTTARGVIPLWVADMDFPCLPELQAAIQERAAHPFFGYTKPDPQAVEAIARWYERYGVRLGNDEVLIGPGTVLSIGICVREFSKRGGGILVMTPVYTPFYTTIKENDRVVVEIPLEPDGEGVFVFNADAVEAAVKQASKNGITVQAAVLCSPHNPGGRVWDREELEKFFEIAARYNIIVISDEIHMDFVYKKKFISAASFDAYKDRIIVLSGANKTFNLGGIHISHIVVRDETLKKILARALYREAAHDMDCFAELAVKTVYTKGSAWVAGLNEYLYRNLQNAVEFLNSVKGVRAFMPQGTYLLWADVKGLVESGGCGGSAELAARLEAEAKVKITSGAIYGGGGEGFARINTASPAALLMEGLERIHKWAQGRQKSQ
jgi:cystathionine beta-lyase